MLFPHLSVLFLLCKYNSITLLMPSGNDRTRLGPNPRDRPPPIPASSLSTSFKRSSGSIDSDMCKMIEIKRPKASATAAVSEPALVHNR